MDLQHRLSRPASPAPGSVRTREGTALPDALGGADSPSDAIGRGSGGKLPPGVRSGDTNYCTECHCVVCNPAKIPMQMRLRMHVHAISSP